MGMSSNGQSADLCAVILAGGQSRRMGFNKALLNVQGRPLIQIEAERVRALTDIVVISSNEVGVYDFLGLPVVPDLYRGQGPLAGLHAAMLHCSRSLFLLIACDLPNLREDFLRTLTQRIGDADAIIPRTDDGNAHPLCGVYRRTCLPMLEHNLRLGINRVTDLFLEPALKVKWFSPSEGAFDESCLHNLNSPSDLSAFLNPSK